MRVNQAVAVALAAVSIALACSSAARAEENGPGADAVFGRTVPAEVMDLQRGKAVITTMDVDGTVSDNAALNNVTGTNVVTSGSFANASGMSTVIQNSGNNVLIQNATILQLDLR
jgi:hypothetical protein